MNAQTVLNMENQSDQPDRGIEFLADMLTGFFHALEGTEPGQNSDHTGISHEVGAIGWPDTGMPGRALEIALDPTNAFTFLQTVLLDDVLANLVVARGTIHSSVTSPSASVRRLARCSGCSSTHLSR